ncbi:bis(5'-nucleosyl)-tetraphosphatase PrpE [Bacillus fonticola]|uniref:bis(5'-nucleosyl)-tetraphosphatase PrpE n=1 Tax=Bacillus fonticola TaxID=2728853 RepID=UPI001475CA94|nr:bis(5'-nucleosyl)-tetraphosphatase PrpE [Bacillus fonticola]
MTFDCIGDIHGCWRELDCLLQKLGYITEKGVTSHPDNRRVVFVGDLTDRGPESIRVIEEVYRLVHKDKIARYVPGNHCNKLYRYWKGNPVQIRHGLETTVAEWEALTPKRQREVRHKFQTLYERAPLYEQLDDGKLIVAHAGIRKDDIGNYSKRVQSFVFYGDTTGEFHPDGAPVRRNWAKDYDGEALIVYGHTPVREPRWINETVNIDTGAVFGGELTALRYPEKVTVAVKSSLPPVEEKFRYEL